MTDRFRPHDLPNSVSEPSGQDRAGRWAAIGRIVLFALLTLFFLLAGLALVIQPALRWGGLVLVTLALVCASFVLLGVVELRGKRLKSGGGPRMARWVLGIASVVFGWLATASALALGSGDRSVYMLILLIAGAGGFAYLLLAWWRFERAQRAKQQSAGWRVVPERSGRAWRPLPAAPRLAARHRKPHRSCRGWSACS